MSTMFCKCQIPQNTPKLINLDQFKNGAIFGCPICRTFVSPMRSTWWWRWWALPAGRASIGLNDVFQYTRKLPYIMASFAFVFVCLRLPQHLSDLHQLECLAHACVLLQARCHPGCFSSKSGEKVPWRMNEPCDIHRGPSATHSIGQKRTEPCGWLSANMKRHVHHSWNLFTT